MVTDDSDTAAVPLGVVVLHTPGHTPDELALWDESETMLYVGDTLYEWAHIIFPSEGSIVQWLQTVDGLIALVTPFPGAIETKPGAATVPFFGIETAILDPVSGEVRARAPLPTFLPSTTSFPPSLHACFFVVCGG